ncbi:MAG: histidine kinase [Desulfobacterales bacterium]|nr:MAG: histidine kinase [Desulfobacterales bacterium]
MKSYFAPAERTEKEKIKEEIRFISANPLMSELLKSVSGLLAVLDENRQILAINETFFNLIGIEDPEEAFGLRMGEAMNCIHAHEEEGGCGTSPACATCGAVIATMISINKGEPAEEICALTMEKSGKQVDMALLVRVQPVCVEDRRFHLLFLRDITAQQQHEVLEKTFYHDINNMIQTLMGASELLYKENPSEMSKTVRTSVFRLKREIALQQVLSTEKKGTYQPLWHHYGVDQIVKELLDLCRKHPAATGKTIELPDEIPIHSLKTDISLLLRVLNNMVINALEETSEGECVRIWFEPDTDSFSFCVWNNQAIPEQIVPRIFQRHFSTKEGVGRGIGTYSMKLFGEQILGGRISFTSSKERGTVFTFKSLA